MTHLSAMFAEQQTSVIDWDGALYSLYELPTEVSNLNVAFECASTTFRQALRLKVRGGELNSNGVAATDLVLWQDTSPALIEVRVRWTGKSRSLRIWNAWDHNGTMHAWVGNAGMRVEQLDPQTLLLRCSDGNGEPSFEDLVARVQIVAS